MIAALCFMIFNNSFNQEEVGNPLGMNMKVEKKIKKLKILKNLLNPKLKWMKKMTQMTLKMKVIMKKSNPNKLKNR